MEKDPERVAAMMLGLGDSHVLGVSEDQTGLFVEVETDLDVAQVRCPDCSSAVVLDGVDEVQRPGPGQFPREMGHVLLESASLSLHE